MLTVACDVDATELSVMNNGGHHFTDAYMEYMLS